MGNKLSKQNKKPIKTLDKQQERTAANKIKRIKKELAKNPGNIQNITTLKELEKIK